MKYYNYTNKDITLDTGLILKKSPVPVDFKQSFQHEDCQKISPNAEKIISELEELSESFDVIFISEFLYMWLKFNNIRADMFKCRIPLVQKGRVLTNKFYIL